MQISWLRQTIYRLGVASSLSGEGFGIGSCGSLLVSPHAAMAVARMAIRNLCIEPPRMVRRKAAFLFAQNEQPRRFRDGGFDAVIVQRIRRALLPGSRPSALPLSREVASKYPRA